MKNKGSFFCSTIGRKQVIGVTGIGLSLFVLGHMLGNLLMYVSPEAYNLYGHLIVSNPLIYAIEASLILIFVSHLGLAIKLTLENKSAKPNSYAVNSDGDKGTGLVQKTLIHQGMIILVFLIWHLLTFKYGPHYEYTVVGTGEVIRDLFKLLVEVFTDPIYVVGYVACVIILGMHLSHGLSSSIRTLGFNHPKYDKIVRLIGTIYAAVVLIGFASQPLFIFMTN